MVPYKNDHYAYKVYVTHIHMFDPVGEINLFETTKARVKKMPPDEDSVTLDVPLELPEKVRKSKSRTLELQLKILLHLHSTSF